MEADSNTGFIKNFNKNKFVRKTNKSTFLQKVLAGLPHLDNDCTEQIQKLVIHGQFFFFVCGHNYNVLHKTIFNSYL